MMVQILQAAVARRHEKQEPSRCDQYQPRDTQDSVLVRVLREHLDAFIEQTDGGERSPQRKATSTRSSRGLGVAPPGPHPSVQALRLYRRLTLTSKFVAYLR
jgi:hypothetical protein